MEILWEEKMPGNNIFRTAMLGGYNKQDVNEYVQTWNMR